MRLQSSEEEGCSWAGEPRSSAEDMLEEQSQIQEAGQENENTPQRPPLLEEDRFQVLFPELPGESMVYAGQAEDAVIAMSTYRLHVQFGDTVMNVPLLLIEYSECREMFQLHVTCKDGKVVRCQFNTLEQCQEWQKRLADAVRPPSRLEELFSFAFHSFCKKEQQGDLPCGPGDHVTSRFRNEVQRMGFCTQKTWRITEINTKYKLCPSYPQLLLVPAWVSDRELESVAAFRSWKRLPAVVYRHQSTGAVIARCAQPEVSWWGWRNADDEHLVQSIAKACAQEHLVNGCCSAELNSAMFEARVSHTSQQELSVTQSPKLLILDARSYAAAVANRAKGGGCECPEYYPSCEVIFMGMANIHAIRKSFVSLRSLCAQAPSPANWLSAVEGTKWLQHLSLLLKAALLVVNAVDRDHIPVLVHCSDGWDRTPQIVALSKMLLDPYYRTIEGFQVLVETEWLDFGHKFADRCGHGLNSRDPNERCPVFLQWLDCVHQLQRQFPCSFQFNDAFLVRLVQHTYSCLFGTFLCNSGREREENRIQERTCSVWSLLQPTNPAFLNALYSAHSDRVLHPVFHVRNLMLWSAVYLPGSSHGASSDTCTPSPDDLHLARLPKTRSFDDLQAKCEAGGTLAQIRRSSDPRLKERWQDDHPLELSVGGTPEGGRTQDSRATVTCVQGEGEKIRQVEEEGDGELEEPSNGMEPKDRTVNMGAELSVSEDNGETALSMEVQVSKEELENILQEASEEQDDRMRTMWRDTNVDHTEYSSEALSPNSGLLAEGPRDQPTHESPLQASGELALSPEPAEYSSTFCPGQMAGVSVVDTTVTADALSHDKGLSEGRLSPTSSTGMDESEDGATSSKMESESSPLAPSEVCGQVDSGEPHVHKVQQMEAGALRRQVQELTPRLELEKPFRPSCQSRCGTEQLTEVSWEQTDLQDTQVTPLYAEPAAAPCYRSRSRTRLWVAGRQHHCRGGQPVEEAWNCGNVFCTSCCNHKAAVENQQLVEPGRVCGACYGSLRLSAVPPPDLELENPIVASSN